MYYKVINIRGWSSFSDHCTAEEVHVNEHILLIIIITLND